MKPSVIIVRERAEQMTGSGCCGKLEGDFAAFGGKPVFAEQRWIMEQVGPIYQKLHEELQDAVDLLIVDPRNQLYLIPRIVKDILRFRPPLKKAYRALFLLFSCPAILVNGQVAYSGRIPQADEVVQTVLTMAAA